MANLTGGQPQHTEKELETVRDILFGAKSREHEQRFDELRNLWRSSLDEARGEFREKLAALEKESRKEFQDILEKIRLEHEAWQKKAMDVSQRLSALQNDHENKLTELKSTEAAFMKMHRDSLADWLKRIDSGSGIEAAGKKH